MKLKNVLFGSAVAVALMFGFASCGENEDEENAISGETISYTNSDSSNLYRSFATTKQKHYSANALITINNPTAKANDSNNANAAYGFVFGLEETTDAVNKAASTTYYEDSTLKTKAKFYTFGIATVRYNAKSKNAEWYVSWCENLPSTNFGTNSNSGFGGTVYDANGTSKEFSTSDVETQIVPSSGTYATVSDLSLTDGALVAQIRVVAETDGSYTVGLYSSATATSVLATATVPKTTTGLSEKTQKYIGRYVTVYSGETASGKIQYSDISGNPIPADYE